MKSSATYINSSASSNHHVKTIHHSASTAFTPLNPFANCQTNNIGSACNNYYIPDDFQKFKFEEFTFGRMNGSYINSR